MNDLEYNLIYPELIEVPCTVKKLLAMLISAIAVFFLNLKDPLYD